VAELTPNLSPAGRVVEAAYIQQLEARAAKEADARAEEQRGIGKSSGEGPDGIVAEVAGDLSSEAEAASESSAQESPKPKYQRTLTTKHFKTALDEIRPSSSEEGTLPELRKWAELFGEGGKKKGKKSGFGKGFGFGDDAKKSSKDFGRVDDGSA
jgi:SpoVK/Ycf46/Vps4 family AAA+-type ATPase